MWVTRAVVIIRMPLTGQAKPHLIQDGRQTIRVPQASQILEKVKIPKISLDCRIQWVLFSLQLNSVCLCWCFYFSDHPGFCHPHHPAHHPHYKAALKFLHLLE